MSLFGQTLVLYLLVGTGVAAAVYLSDGGRNLAERWFRVATALPFWPLYIPILLARGGTWPPQKTARQPPPRDEMANAIAQVDAELEGALSSLDGWAEDVLAREKTRINELRATWTTQAERIREMDRLLALPEYAIADSEATPPGGEAGTGSASDRLRHSQHARRQNIERLRQVRRRAYQDLMGTLAWVRELVSMIHLAKFTGAPAARAEELVAQIAAAVEGLSELTWQDEPPVAVGDDT
jgi:hypothetical protein